MTKYRDVGRSWRTPAKHGLMSNFVGQEIGAANAPKFASVNRLTWIDLTAGDAAPVDGEKWHRSCSPGILAHHAAYRNARTSPFTRKPVEIVLYEIQAATYDRLLANLAEQLPTLGYEKDGEGRWCWADRVSITTVNLSGHAADVTWLRQTDAVLAFNDPNAITEWAMRNTFAQEVKDRGVWAFRSLSTLGCNTAGIKRIDLDDGSGDAKRERRAWFDLIAAQQAALPSYRDLLLAGIERDEAQWAYLLCTAQKWRSSTESVVASEFRKIERTTVMRWFAQDPIGFESIKRTLFLTKRERDGL